MQASLDEFTGNMINEGHNPKLQILQCAPVRCLTNQNFFILETQLAFSSVGCCYIKKHPDLKPALPSFPTTERTPLPPIVRPMAVEDGQ